MLRGPLRIGLLVDSDQLPAWNLELIRRMQAEDWLDVTTVIRKQALASEVSWRRAAWRLLRRMHHNTLYAAYTRIDRRLARCSPDPFALSPWRTDLPAARQIYAATTESKHLDRIDAASVSAIAAERLDVIWRCGFRILRGDILQVARYGVWSFHHGDNTQNRGSMPGFWEVMLGHQTTGAILQILTDQLDNGIVLDRFVGATEPYSVAGNQHNLYWKAAAMLTATLRRLYGDPSSFVTRHSLESSVQRAQQLVVTAQNQITTAAAEAIPRLGAESNSVVQSATEELYTSGAASYGQRNAPPGPSVESVVAATATMDAPFAAARAGTTTALGVAEQACQNTAAYAGLTTPPGADQGLSYYCHPLRTQPTNQQVCHGLGRLAARFVADKASHTFQYDQWFLAYHWARSENARSRAMYEFQELHPPKNAFWADPFIWIRDGKYYIFFEECLYATNRAHICVMELDQDGQCQHPVRALQRPYHLSYPFLFEYEDVLYMIPETGENRTIELYKCVDFPAGWELDRVIMDDVDAADTTLFFDQQRWWMFTCLTEKGLLNRDTLYLYHADSPFGPWEPHPQNPIKRDVTGARPAGNLFQHQGRLYRPAQDCAKRYGHATNVFEIQELSPTEYRERPATRLSADWRPGLLGTHTINKMGRLTVIDGEMLRPRIG